MPQKIDDIDPRIFKSFFVVYVVNENRPNEPFSGLPKIINLNKIKYYASFTLINLTIPQRTSSFSEFSSHLESKTEKIEQQVMFVS